ncbi:MAG: ABC transporter ATP-binding protein/permease [Polyangiaceae bacterium]|nr:ABC transporter ATP-binding protein/permease [Polyangiaceae bacterium]
MRAGRISRFWTYLRPFSTQLVLLFAVIAGSIFALLPAPWLEKRIIDDAIPGGDTRALLLLVASIAGLFALGRGLSFARGYLSAKVRQRVLTDVRMHMYEHLQRMSQRFFARHGTGGLLSRITHDVEQVQNLLNDKLFEVVASGIKIVAVIGFLFAISPKLTLLCAIPLPIVAGIFLLLRKRVYRENVALQETHARLSDRIQQNFSGMKVIQAEVLEDRMRDETLRTSRELERVSVRREVLAVTGDLMTTLVAYVPIVSIIWGVGGTMVIRDTLTLGSLLAFTQYLFGLIMPITQLFRFNMELQAGYAALDRIYDILDEEPDIKDAPDAVELREPIETITFDDVSLAFAEGLDAPRYALRHVSFEVRRGERLALVGPSGAGKTSVINLLLRFYRPTSGQIRINGQPIERFTIESLRRAMAYVSQEVFLFSGTVRQNLTLGRDVPNPKISTALSLAAADDFVSKMRGGVDATVDEQGTNMSGGQRQRLAIARMALKDATVCLLDEATAALDSQSERLVLERLHAHLADRTAVVIAHRFSFLQVVHRVLVLTDGRLVEDGTVQALLARRGVFYALHEAQHA